MKFRGLVHADKSAERSPDLAIFPSPSPVNSSVSNVVALRCVSGKYSKFDETRIEIEIIRRDCEMEILMYTDIYI